MSEALRAGAVDALLVGGACVSLAEIRRWSANEGFAERCRSFEARVRAARE